MIIKKLINTAFFYIFLALVFGVFYREFTKFNHFTGITNLSLMHAHLFMLGGVMFFIIALFSFNIDILSHKNFNTFYKIYNVGILITSAMFFIRGILQVKEVNLTKAIDASISGVAGIGHTLIAIGLVLLFLIFKNAMKSIK